MSIRAKLLAAFCGVSLLIGLLGAAAFIHNISNAEDLALDEALAVARVFARFMDYNRSTPWKDPDLFLVEMQGHVSAFKKSEDRDIVVVDRKGIVIADAVPSEVGKPYGHDPAGEVAKTIEDGNVRKFEETSKDSPNTIKQVVVPLRDELGGITGALILEYTPLYNEILDKAKANGINLLAVYLIAVGASIALGYAISRHITRPLREVERAAWRIAGGELGARVKHYSEDELGSMAQSFNRMADAIREQQARLLDAHSVLTQEIAERSRVEAVLRESEEKFRTVFESAKDAIFILDTEGKFIDINSVGYERLGYSKQEMLDMDIAELDLPEFREQLPQRIAMIAERGGAVFESAHLRKDGSAMPVEVNAFVSTYRGRSVIYSIVRDITERKAAEVIRRVSEERLNRAQHIAHVGDWEWEVATGRMLWSDELYRMFGYAPGEIRPDFQMVADAMHPMSREAFLAATDAALAAGGPFEIEYNFYRKDGSLGTMHMIGEAVRPAQGEPERMMGIAWDITERRRGEDAVRESDRKYRELVESVNSIVLRWDSEGRVLFMNRFGLRFFGFEEREIVGRNVVGTIVPETESTGRDLIGMIRDIHERPDDFSKNINENVRKDGSRAWIWWANKPVLDGLGRLIEILSIGNDITEQRRAEEELRQYREGLEELVLERTQELNAANEHLKREMDQRMQMEEELLRAQKIESLGVMAGGIAHDFNNALTAIVNHLAVLKMSPRADESMLKWLTSAENAAMNARALTQQLLTFSRGGTPLISTIHTKDVIREAVDFCLMGSGVGCSYSLPEDLWPGWADEGQLRQAIHNLVINACHAMPNGGLIEVSAENVTVPPGGPLPLGEGRYVKFSIRDHGVGIQQEHMQSIFDPYFTTKQKGSGLGLTTTYSIIKRHGGHISVESEPGRGTVFHVYIPASQEAAAKTVADDKLYYGSGRVMVLDDEKEIRESLALILWHLGYDVDTVSDGEEAVRMYAGALEARKPYSAVIMDLTIPGGMGGLEAVRLIREMDTEACAVVSSGYASDSIKADFRSYGFCDIITKPYTTHDLSRVLHRVIEASRASL